MSPTICLPRLHALFFGHLCGTPHLDHGHIQASVTEMVSRRRWANRSPFTVSSMLSNFFSAPNTRICDLGPSLYSTVIFHGPKNLLPNLDHCRYLRAAECVLRAYPPQMSSPALV